MGLLLPLLVVLLIAILFSFNGKRLKFTSPIMYKKRAKYILIIYSSILLFSTVLFYLIQPQLVPINKEDNQEIIYEINNYVQDFYAAINEGETEAISQLEKWQFPYTGDTIEISNNNHHFILMVERKKTEDDTIDVTYLTTKTFIEGVEFTDYLKPPTVELSGGRIIIGEPPPVTINVAKFDKEFTINQFYKENRWMNEWRSSIGMSAIYIQIPRNVEVIQQEHQYIEYVGE
ncbi:hypothetical protein BKP37_02435 [Anaerobacillus alkalilacustris]|uniref:Uncharacterized protein n=1 Tax=Anaerobacillus alkalilacustris TaxID=393763 RepID=A0A1S2LY18_9BACI|nr:hypothetical protein [Anaerobacillus alkalilacustris]OIJ17381.1 hypothetical protein BKP37_02435 [Anaerobacillus alkalilacustris]